jgi:hypothetical protein
MVARLLLRFIALLGIALSPACKPADTPIPTSLRGTFRSERPVTTSGGTYHRQYEFIEGDFVLISTVMLDRPNSVASVTKQTFTLSGHTVTFHPLESRPGMLYLPTVLTFIHGDRLRAEGIDEEFRRVAATAR